MNKVWLIIKREYLTRVKKKSFIIMTILGPLLMAGLGIAAFWLSLKESEEHRVLVIDENYPMFKPLTSDKLITFVHEPAMSAEQAQNFLNETEEYTDMLYLPKNIIYGKLGKLVSKKQPSLAVLSIVENKVEKLIELEKLKMHNVDREVYDQIKTDFRIEPLKINEQGELEDVEFWKAAVGFVLGLFIYMFIFMYGVQVMRGVIEEKVNRIVEVIVSSVKPFQMMIGKIIGVAMVGLTQYMLWVVLTFVIFSIGSAVIFSDVYDPAALANQQMTGEVLEQSQEDEKLAEFMADPNGILNRINFPLILSCFLFYFLFGYLLYSAMFAAVGSAVDNETDTQQFMMPVTLPLIFAYIISIGVIQNPEGPAGFWFSMIPFTSPVVMMVRIAMGVATTLELITSMLILVATFILMTWLAGKIYRTGIMMYGKKPTWGEIFKWLRYKG